MYLLFKNGGCSIAIRKKFGGGGILKLNPFPPSG